MRFDDGGAANSTTARRQTPHFFATNMLATLQHTRPPCVPALHKDDVAVTPALSKDMSAIKSRAVISGLLGATASCVGKVALDPSSPVQSSARGLCNRFVPAEVVISALTNTTIPSGQVCTGIELGLRGVCLLLMVGTNAAMMATFLEGMNESGTVAGTALANAANFSLSAIYGMVFFEESITTLWMVGFAMILVGAWILSSIQLKDNNTVKKKDR